MTRPARPPLSAAARLVAVLGVVAIVVLSLLPGGLRPHTGWAKTLEHAVAYLAVATVLGAAYGEKRVQPALWLAVLAAVLELLQFGVPGRTPALADFFASATGAFLGAELARLLPERLRRLVA